MLKQTRQCLSLMLIAVMILTSVFSGIQPVFADEVKQVIPRHQSNQVFVKYENLQSRDTIKAALKKSLKAATIKSVTVYGDTQIELIELGSAKEATAAVAQLEKEKGVLYATLNDQTALLTSEPSFNEQWGLSNTGQIINRVSGQKGMDIGAEKAWAMTKGSPAILIGVLDSGVDISHPDLKNNIYNNTYEIPSNNIDDDGNGYIDDVNGWNFSAGSNVVYSDAKGDAHGTLVSGIIAAEENNQGTIGVAPQVKILSLKFMDKGVGYTSDAINAIRYARSMGVKIVNCSFGTSEMNEALYDTMKAYDDMLFICAAGNNGQDTAKNPVYPAAYDLPNVISVAAATHTGELSAVSNYGKDVDVAAPGLDILSTAPEGKYKSESGASIATAFVTGEAALLKSKMAELSPIDLAREIKNSAVKTEELTQKINGGFVNAGAALSALNGQSVTTKTEGQTQASSADAKGAAVYALAASVPAYLLEQIHYGEDGVSVSTGNYSKTFTDFSMPASGFTLNIARTYNSKDSKQTSMGAGWTFGFEASVKPEPSNASLYVAKLPDGKANTFVKNGDGSFTANDSRSKLAALNGGYVLTTKDQYRYEFNASGFISAMVDRNGNKITITTNAEGKVTKISDMGGRNFIVAYNAQNRIGTITDPIGNKYTYTYDGNGRLTQVTDPMGVVTATYAYDGNGLLTSIKDGKSSVTSSMAYDGTSKKVTTFTDEFGNAWTYTYNDAARTTTAKDAAGRSIVKGYDTSYYVTSTTDPEGKVTTVEYYVDGSSNNAFGEEKSITDRNGNKTSFTRDERGNILQMTNPDGSSKKYTYDALNNCTSEKDEVGRTTYYVYDANGIRLLEKVRPVNGTDAYDTASSDRSKFAITSYEYYDDDTAASLKIPKGLVKVETDPEGFDTTYNYDQYGNATQITTHEGNTTTHTYNQLGAVVSTKSAKGYVTKYVYDNNNRLIKKILHGGETYRTVYDANGRVVKSIAPNQYGASNDGAAAVGERYEYDNSGKVTKHTDAAGNESYFTYDVYGNVKTKKVVDAGSQATSAATTRYEYDVMNRISKTFYKENDGSAEVQIEAKAYEILSGGKVKVTTTTYLNETQTAITKETMNWRNQVTEVVNPEGGKVTTTYHNDGMVSSVTNPIGGTSWYKYDGLGNQTENWVQVSASKYQYTATLYYKNGTKHQEVYGKDPVELFKSPATNRATKKTFVYASGGRVLSETNSKGGKTTYKYDADGFVEKTENYKGQNDTVVTLYKNNYLGKPVERTEVTRIGDLQGNDVGNDGEMNLTSKLSYDLSGNLVKTVDAKGFVTTFGYDAVNRQISETKRVVNESGKLVDAKVQKSLSASGKTLKETDAKGTVTTYTYDGRDNLIKVDLPNGGTRLMAYDLGSRKIAEVSPNNYIQGKTLAELARTEFIYDLDNNNVAVKEWMKSADGTFVSTVVNAKRFDKAGRATFEADGEGYHAGIAADNTSGQNPKNKGDVEAVFGTGSAYGTTFGYDFAGHVTSELDAVSKQKGSKFALQYTYDGMGRKIKETWSTGAEKSYAYDDDDLLTQVSTRRDQNAPDVTLESRSYDLLGNLTSKKDANGNVIKLEYNSRGNLYKVTYPTDESTPAYTVTIQYDKNGNRGVETHSTGKLVQFEYDSMNRLKSKAESDLKGGDVIKESTKYDVNGNTRYTTDGNGNVKEFTYNSSNQPVSQTVKVTRGDGSKVSQTTNLAYDLNGNQTIKTDWLGNKWTSVYDSMNRLVEKQSPQGVIEKLEYNKSSKQVKSTNAKGAAKTFSYDLNSRLVRTVDEMGYSNFQEYDVYGNVIKKIDGKNNATTLKYDHLGKLLEVVNTLGEKTSYTYDKMGNLTSTTDGNGNVQTFEYNCRNQQVKRIDAGGRTGSPGNFTYKNDRLEAYTYTPDGKLKTKVDRNGVTWTFTYDIHGRRTLEDAGGLKTSYTYDDNGNQTSVANESQTIKRSYDGLNRTLTKTIVGSGTFVFSYDVTSNPSVSNGEYAEITKDLKGVETVRVFDTLGRMKSVGLKTDAKPTTYTYDEVGNRTATNQGNGVKSEYAFNAKNQLVELKNLNKDGTTIETFTYTYDAVGNQLTKVSSKGTTSYSYDVLNRLTKVVEPSGKTTEYTYDASGNRELERVSSGLVDHELGYYYNDQNRLTKTVKRKPDGSKETINYAYDPNGNQTGKTYESTKKVDPLNPPDASFGLFVYGQTTTNLKLESIIAGTASYEYNKRNELIKTTGKTSTATYKYNGDGYRSEKAVVENGKTATTKFYYEADKVVLELDQNGKFLARNVYGLLLESRVVATPANERLSYTYNGHGDVTALVNDAGAIKGKYDYDAFGNITQLEGNANNSVQYAGYQFDSESGLYYLNARHYDPVTARFMQEDTYRGQQSDPLSLNLYTYCHNEPIKYTDPTGHATEGGGGGQANKITKELMQKNQNKNMQQNSSALRDVQRDLISLGYKNVKDNGKLDSATQKAIIDFQQKHNLVPDGIVGAKTDAKMEAAVLAKNSKTGEVIKVQPAGPVASAIGYKTVPTPQTIGPKDSNKTLTSKPMGNIDSLSKFNNGASYIENPKVVAVNFSYMNDATGTIVDTGKALTGMDERGNKLTSGERGVHFVGALIPGVTSQMIKQGLNTAEVVVDVLKGGSTLGKGAYNGNVYDGTGFGKLLGKEINPTDKGLSIVKQHLSGEFSDVTNDAMIASIQQSIKNGNKLTGADASFYMHELNEATLMKKGMLYDDAHALSLQKYDVSPFSVYSPEVIKAFPDAFGRGFKKFWGIE